MMEEQLSGLLPSNFDFLYELLENFPEEAQGHPSVGNVHNCEALSFQLSYRLKDSLVVNVPPHTFVYYKGEIWIDIHVGIIIDKNFKKYQKLTNFDQLRFDQHWGIDGNMFSGDKLKNFTFIEIKHKGVKKFVV
tara:strand:- start:411 stop:812 length:402 start_codon:yes stop_codon:yes gene_type:complete